MGASTFSITGNGSQPQPLGRLLIERGHVTEDQLDQALRYQQHQGGRLGELMCELGHIEPHVLHEALAEQAGVPRVDLEAESPAPDALAVLTSETALQHKVLPYAIRGPRGETIALAMADPFDQEAVEAVRELSGRRVRRYFCPEPELLEALRNAYGSNVARMIADMGGSSGNGESAGGVGDRNDGSETQPTSAMELQELAREPSVVNLVNLVLLEAIEAQASDVHIEPFEKSLKVKYRIDGVLQEMPPPPRHLYAAVVSRIKIMSGMDIAERFVPQDGHITFNTPRGQIDIRVATVPTVYGESVAMRLLDRAIGLIGLEKLGMPRAQFEPFKTLLDKPHGIVLVTGPTGSGKTTTLYAALNHIYTPEKKIITIEDPVEYQLEGINQIPVNRKRGIDFASGLRAILRQDPDVIMVGEIRDRETADIAIRSALTGHLVFSTLHTNDTCGAVTRLLDMGVEPYLLSSSLEGVLAQRLVRRVCPHCRQPEQPEPKVLARLGHHAAEAEGATFYRGTGCRHCRQTGYMGRTGLFELLRIGDAVRHAILERATAAEISAAAGKEYQPMREDGFHRALAGHTTLEEVLRVTQDSPAEEALGLDA